jgi:phage baseplate assembly protein W
MIDLSITDNGDLQVASSGDLAITTHKYSADLQQTFMIVRTERGDFIPYPTFGSNLYKLWGLPNTPQTGNRGMAELSTAITTDGRLANANVQIKAIPTAANAIRFDVDIQFGRSQTHIITLEQKLSSIRG